MVARIFRIAIRNLLRSKGFSFINVFGLAVGLTTCLYITLYITDETSVDAFHPAEEKLFRISSSNEKGETWAAAMAPLSDAIQKELPEVEKAARLLTFPDIATMLVSYQGDGAAIRFFESNGYYTDPGFPELLNYRFTLGDGTDPLGKPNTMVISEAMARKYFAKENPVGKVLKITTPLGAFDYTVTGVFSSRQKSHIQANFLLSMNNSDMGSWAKAQDSWISNNIFYTYVRLKPQSDEKSFAAKLDALYQSKAGAGMKAAGFSKSLFLQPVRDIYLKSAAQNEIKTNGNITFLYILAIIGGLILLIACVNFINLATARSQRRAKEIGVRKVLGASRTGLVWQFLGESMILCLIAMLLAVCLSVMLLPVFNSVSAKNLQLAEYPSIIAGIFVLLVITGLTSGLYPAFILSSFKPVTTLKKGLSRGFSGISVRKGLVVFQFTVSVCLIFAAITIWRQLNLLENRELGFSKTHKLVIPMQQAYKNAEQFYLPLKNELLKNPAVTAVTSGSSYPGIPILNDLLFVPDNQRSREVTDIHLAAIEPDYLKALGIGLLRGRTFNSGAGTDSAAIIINETAARQLGFDPAGAVGKKIYYNVRDMSGSLEIIGVTRDFNFESLRSQIRPFGFTKELFSSRHGYTIASIGPGDVSSAIKMVEKTWNRLYPDVPFVYSFMDSDFSRNYDTERRTSRITIYFTIVAIVIACLGLFGLASFSTGQRSKEIGIRKLLGASVSRITSLLSREFIQLVLLAIVIGLPLAAFAAEVWLRDFVYRVHLVWWMFPLSAVTVVLIALISVSFETVRAAVTNPARVLRN